MSREREAQPPQPVDAPAQGLKPHQRVQSLAAQARSDADAAEALVDALIAMRAPGDEADEARVVLQHLDAKSLDGIIDAKGRRAKHEAVETLLSLGFPHALNVSPEDLADYRRSNPEELGAQVLRKDRTDLWLSIFAAAAEAGIVASTLPSDDRRFTWWALAACTLTAGGIAWRFASRARAGAWPATLGALGVLASGAVAALSGTAGLTLVTVIGLGLLYAISTEPWNWS